MAFTYLMPVFTAFFAAIFLDESITMTTIVCGAAIVLGLWLVNRSKSQAAPPASRSTARSEERPSPATEPSPDPG